MASKARSLRSRLITRLIVVQVVVVLLFSMVTIYAFMLMNEAGTRVLDPRDPDIVADAITRLPDGSLSVTNTVEMRRLRADAPGLWFVVRDEAGITLAHGNIPLPFRPIAEDLSRFGRSYISESAQGGEYSAAVHVVNSAAGPVRIIIGGGRRVGFAYGYFIVASRFILPLAAVLAIMTIIAIPWIIRRELRGVSAAAAEANRIDIDQRGARLPDDGLPSEVQPMVKAVNEALARLDEGYARQKRFLAYAAHELKTPIAILLTRLETSAVGKDRDRLVMDVARLANLVDQLLDAQRFDRGVDSGTCVDLVKVAEQVAADLAPLVIASGYELVFRKEIDAFPVRGDWTSLEHVVTNLVQNAVAHGGGHGEILMRIERDGALEVIDEGAGVPEEDREKVFEPFYRVRPRDRGTGLGLSLVDDIVRRHGGHVTIGDGPSGGALFRINIPRA